MQPLLDCLKEITFFLQLNDNKTEGIVFGPSKFKTTIPADLGPLAPYVKSHEHNLGVVFDSHLKIN